MYPVDKALKNVREAPVAKETNSFVCALLQSALFLTTAIFLEE